MLERSKMNERNSLGPNVTIAKGTPVRLPTGPLVTVVVPTCNSELHLEKCLSSIADQEYEHIELVVIDNWSTDRTTQIASSFADKIVTSGPERSAQVNIGAQRASGRYLFRVDADFQLDRRVVGECVTLMLQGADAVVVHNTPDESAGWLARIRKFEVDMYKYSHDHSAARFLETSRFIAIGGLNEAITAGEDYDFHNRLVASGAQIAFAQAEAVHLGEPDKIGPLLKKYYWYGKDFPNYMRHNRVEARTQLSFVRRDYIRHWRRFISHPTTAIQFIAYHVAKYCAGALGYCVGSAALFRRRVAE